MEVNSLSQGRQNAFESNISSSNINSQNIQVQDSSNLEYKVPQSSECEKTNSQQRNISERDVKIAADKLNKLFEGTNTHVEYEIIGKSRTMSIKIIDDKTKEVIKEVPSKKIIEMIDKLCEMAGIMVDEKV